MSGWAVSATRATAATRVLASTATGLGVAMTNIGRGILSFFGGPLGLAVVAGTVAFTTFRNSARENEIEMENNAKKASETANEIENLRDKYLGLAGQTDLTATEQDELRTVTSQLLDLVPSAITGFDNMGNAITDMGTAAEVSAGQVAMLREENERLVKAKAAVAESVLPSLYEDLKKQEGDFEKLAESTRLGSDYARGALLDNPEGKWQGYNQLKTFFADDEEVAKAAEKRLNTMVEDLGKLRKEISGYEVAQKAAAGIDTTEQTTTTKPKTPGYVGGTPTKSSTNDAKEQITTLIDLATQYADAQQALNTQTQRDIDISEARANYYERIGTGLQDQLTLMDLYKQKQAGLHTEAEALRIAIGELEDQQKSLDTSTEDGQEAFDQMGQEIEKLKDRITGLSTEWMQLQIATEDAVAEYIQKAREIESELELKSLESQRDAAIQTLQDLKEAAQDASDARIQSIQDEIDALEEENTLLKEQEEIEDKLETLAKAKEKLANVEADKNTRIWKDGTWQYIANPKDLKAAQDAVEDAREDYYDTLEKQAEAARKRELQAQLKAEQEKQEAEQESFDNQLENEEEYWKEKIETSQTYWAKMTSQEQINLDAFNEVTRSGIQTALRKWESYYQRVLEIQAMTGGTVSTAATITAEAGNDWAGTSLYKTGSFDTGGPIYADQLAMVHEREYVLNADTVKAAGGFAGVEKLVAAIRMPNFAPASSQSYSTINKITNNNDRSIGSLNVNMSHVVDAPGFLRNFRQIMHS